MANINSKAYQPLARTHLHKPAVPFSPMELSLEQDIPREVEEIGGRFLPQIRLDFRPAILSTSLVPRWAEAQPSSSPAPNPLR